jgi:general secretion pathway protein G
MQTRLTGVISRHMNVVSVPLKDMKKSGFTLIELLVVIAIIGMLAGLITANFAGVRERARDSRRKAEFDQIKKSLRLYYNDNQVYPDPGDLPWGAEFSDGNGGVYMGRLPQDPLYDAGDPGTPEYSYAVTPDGDNFCLTTTIENKSDKDALNSQTRCSSACDDANVALSGQMYASCAD